ncbi:hypothetical protein HVH02_004799 [Salmonella enterica]|nr:hypothetical protein [Salmonella enterica]
MTGLLLPFKTILTGLVIVLSSFSVTAYALLNNCEVTGGQNISLRNINLTTDEFTPGPGSVIYTTSQNVTFNCQVASIYPGQKPALVFNQSFFSNFSSQLTKMGLGLQVTITEAGASPVIFTWEEIKGTGGGNELRKAFGNVLPIKNETKHNATIKLDFLYLTAYKESSTVKTFPASDNDILNIIPLPQSSRTNGFILSSFNVRILRRGLGKVDITPSLVNLGHFYTTYEPSQSKQAGFTVTARQALRPAVGQEFTLPLEVTFGKGALLSSDTSNQTLKLVNQDGNANGLLLSIKDNTGRPVIFDKKEALGDININSQLSGNVSKTYTAEVTPVPGGTLKTGKFSAAIPVTVTYN